MNLVTNNKNGKENIQDRLNQFKSKHKRQASVATTFWLVLMIITASIIFIILQSKGNVFFYSTLSNIVHALLLSVIIVNWIYLFPFLGILVIIVYETRNRHFLFQLNLYLGFLLLITFVGIMNFVDLQEDLLTMVFIVILLVIVALESYSFKLVLNDLKTNKQPLFLWSFFQNSFETYSSTLLTQQSMQIPENLDGYSQRPMYIKFESLENISKNKEEFNAITLNYIKFLSSKNEIIGWKFDSETIRLYPRVLMGEVNMGLGIRYIWSSLFKILRKKGLTSIIIDYKQKELSIKIAEQDYELLNDVTYHILGKLVLEKFRESMLLFNEGDLEKSYKILFPIDKT